jgi:excisionase family DNA binding protein
VSLGLNLDAAFRQLLRELLREELPGALRAAMQPAGPASDQAEEEAPAPDTYLTIEEVGRILTAHPSTVRRLIRKGDLRSSGAGRLCRVRRRHLDEFMARGHGPKLVVDDEKARVMVARALRRRPSGGA